jgi:hypothetical protein
MWSDDRPCTKLMFLNLSNRFSIPFLAPSLQFNCAAAWNSDTSVWILTLFHLFSLDFHSGLSTYVGQNKLTQYVFLVWTDHWKCCIYISYKCQHFNFISFEMVESTSKPLLHIYYPDMLWDLLVYVTWVSVLVGVRDMDNEQRLTPVCVPYVKLLHFNSSGTASPDQQICTRSEGWEVPSRLVPSRSLSLSSWNFVVLASSTLAMVVVFFLLLNVVWFPWAVH